MKNRLTLVSLWLLSAAGTFALGLAVKSKPEPAAENSPAHSRLSAMPGRPASSLANVQAPSNDPRLESGTTGFGPAPAELAKYFGAGSQTIEAEDMATAIKDMRRENDPLKRRAMFTQLLDHLTPENAKAALLALREGRGGRGRGPWGGGDEERLVLNAWGRIDGAGAIAELEAMAEERRNEREAQGETDGGGGRGGRGGFDRGGFDIASVLSGWATSDATAAMGYVSGVEDERQKGMLTGSIVSGLMVNGVDEAVAFIGTLPQEDENRGRHMWRIAEDVLEDGVDNAAQWVTSLSDDSLKDGAMRRIADSFARENLEEAVAWVADTWRSGILSRSDHAGG